MKEIRFLRDKRKLAVAVLVMAAWILVWPVGVFEDTLISRTAADYSMNTGGIGEIAAIQEFVPKYDHIKSVGIDIGKLNGEADHGVLHMDFFDANLNQFARFSRNINEMNDGTLTDVEVDLKLKAGETYFLSVQCEDYGEKPPVLHYRSLAGNGPEENTHFYYGPSVIGDASANIRYIYYIPLNFGQILFYDSLALLLGVTAIYLLDRRKKANEGNKQ